jgi:hypothetical protein
MSSLPVSSQAVLMKMTTQHFILLGAFVALETQENNKKFVKNDYVVPLPWPVRISTL